MPACTRLSYERRDRERKRFHAREGRKISSEKLKLQKEREKEENERGVIPFMKEGMSP